MSRLKELRTPVFWVEGHPGALDREGWEIEVTGFCDKPGRITWSQLLSMPKTIADARLTSVTRFSVRGKWGGVKVSDSDVGCSSQRSRRSPVPAGWEARRVAGSPLA